jgi:asparagine synthase (glutamine-hydrolysing)
MSCICGIVHFDGRAVDRDVLTRMSASMRSSAPDRETIDIRRNVGFAHNLLQIDKKSERRLPVSQLHQTRMLVADARIDARADFLHRLTASGCFADSRASDADLLLRAYDAYGHDLVEHLVGDFAFALWDDAKQTLLLARDQFGARPIFYAQIECGIVFATQIRALLQHPEISDEQSEIAVSDFLMFGHFTDDSMTIYRQIKRLPGAHLLHSSPNSVDVSRYWRPPIGRRIRYEDLDEYAEHFFEVFSKAVIDRLEGDVIAMEMSGGMDSTSIAAVAASSARVLGFELQTHTVSCKLFLREDEEGHYAALAAAHLGVNNRQWAIGPMKVQWGQHRGSRRYDEPTVALDNETDGAIISHMADSGARVMLTGIGGDLMFSGGYALPHWFGGTAEVLRQIGDLIDYKRAHGTVRGLGIRASFLPTWLRRTGWDPGPLPEWFLPEFVHRTGMRDRWATFWHNELPVTTLQAQFARRAFCAPLQPYTDHHQPILARHPFHDVRVAEFCAALPIAAVAKKQPLVRAMRSQLPSEVLARPKTPLQGDLVHARLRATANDLARAASREPILPGLVDQTAYLHALHNYMFSEPPQSTWVSVYTTSPLCYLRWKSTV